MIRHQGIYCTFENLVLNFENQIVKLAELAVHEYSMIFNYYQLIKLAYIYERRTCKKGSFSF